MVTKQNRKLSKLKNVGKKITARLNELGIFACIAAGLLLANAFLSSESGRDFRPAGIIAGVLVGLFAFLLRSKYQWSIKILIFSLIPIELVFLFAIMSGSGSYAIDVFNLRWLAGLNIFILLPWIFGISIGSAFIRYKV